MCRHSRMCWLFKAQHDEWACRMATEIGAHVTVRKGARCAANDGIAWFTRGAAGTIRLHNIINIVCQSLDIEKTKLDRPERYGTRRYKRCGFLVRANLQVLSFKAPPNGRGHVSMNPCHIISRRKRGLSHYITSVTWTFPRTATYHQTHMQKID